MSRVFLEHKDIMELEIPPDSFFFKWYTGDRVKIYTHGLYSGGIGAIPLSGVIKADKARKLIEDYEERFKRGEKQYKIINPIIKIENKGDVF
jgi:hypothetical protein